jgi:preprotein translocase subunit SecF
VNGLNCGPSVVGVAKLQLGGGPGCSRNLLYITLAFRGVSHAFRYGVAAIIAMLHDVAVVIGVEAIIAHFLHWEVDSLFLTALLTVIGFSVHDTIVVFDRIRENLTIYRKLPYETVVNHSIVQTLVRRSTHS